MAKLTKGAPKNKSVDAKNNEIIKIMNDRNDQKKKYRVEVEQEFNPPMSKKAMQKIKP
jgi:hypothetical protein